MIVVAFIAIVAMVFTSLPYVQGARLANDNVAYLGVNSRAPADTNVYVSMIEDIRQGGLAVTNLFTPEHGQAVLFHPLWIEMGLLSRLLHISPLVVFHSERVIFGILFVFILYAILRSPFQAFYDRIGALLVILFSAGFGIIYFIPYMTGSLDPEDYVAKLPLDIWVSESNTFLTLYHSALFILSQILIVVILVAYYRGVQKNKLFLVGESFLLALLTWIHPYDVVSIVAITVVIEFFAFTKKSFRQQLQRHLLFLLPTVFVVAYYYVFVLQEPSIAGWGAQNITEMPPFRNVLLGYGLLLPFASVGAIVAWTRNRTEDRLWVLWALSTALLVSFAFLPFARRLTNGWHLPLAILGFMGWQTLWQWTKDSRRQSLTVVITWVTVLVMLLSLLSIVFGDMRQNRERSSPFFVSRDVIVASDWIKKNTTKEDVLYAQPFLGNVLPAYAGRRVYIGHGHQTIDWEDRLDFVINTLYHLSPQDQIAFFRETGIDYVMTTPQENVWGPNLPGQGLLEVYRRGTVTVWKVLPKITSPAP